MDWDKLRIFHTVAEAGSFTHAGVVLNLHQSAVSRQISALEDSLKAPLFHRHARGLILTEQGEYLLHAAREVFAKLSMTEAILTESKEHPKGPLKVTTTVTFGINWLAPRLKNLTAAHPDINLTLLLHDHELDLSMREADVAIRMGAPRQPDLVQRHLLSIGLHIYGHVDYLKRHGTPQSLEALCEHTIITFPAPAKPPFDAMNWLRTACKTTLKRPCKYIEINNIYAIYNAVESGAGLATLPDYMTAGNPNMVRILPEHCGPLTETFFVYAEELRHSKRIAVFPGFFGAGGGGERGWMIVRISNNINQFSSNYKLIIISHFFPS